MVMEPLEGKMAGHQRPTDISTRLQRVAELSRRNPERAWNTLAHHIDVEFLREAFRRMRKDGAPGVDGRTAAEYAERLEENLPVLVNSFNTGSYRAPPVRRAYIPKDNGKQRPIGMPTIEDKLLQRAVTMVLNAVYEQDFLDCSYGFRPGRSAHQALEILQRELVTMGGGFVLDVDIESFFDSLDHGALRGFLDTRIRDGVLRRAIDKWLKAGVMEDGTVRRFEAGSPQGGVISPLLANIYLHEVVDVWFERTVKPVMRGRAVMVRYADDIVFAFARKDDARRVLETLSKRLAEFGLRLSAEKTRLVPFERPPLGPPRGPAGSGPGTFNFLGFTHYWAKSRQGKNVVKRKTAKDRLRRAIHRASEWCRRHRHLPVPEQWHSLKLKLQGHYAYYGITGNSRSLAQLFESVRCLWRKWLDRRSQRARMNWQRYARLLERYPLPAPRIVHSWNAASPSP